MRSDNHEEVEFNTEKLNKKVKYTLIDTIMDCVRTVEDILLKESIMALDCEGVLLSKEGRLTLLQISLLDERVFIFDILKGGSLMFLGLDENRKGLKAVLENKKILKLIHDCRNDWDSLLHQYSVRIYNFIDTQEAYFIFKIFYYQEITLPISLSKFIENITNAKLELKQKFKNVMNEDPYMWGNRPLTEEQLAYASEDVAYLIKAWLDLRDKFNENLKEIIFFLTILKVVDISMFGQFKEYLIANIIYFGMLENVFSSNEVYMYIFAVDYVYNFLQIKIMTDKKQGENLFPVNDCNLLPDEDYYRFVKEEKTTASIIKFGLNFKEKQRILSLKQFKEEEMIYIQKISKLNNKYKIKHNEQNFYTCNNYTNTKDFYNLNKEFGRNQNQSTSNQFKNKNNYYKYKNNYCNSKNGKKFNSSLGFNIQKNYNNYNLANKNNSTTNGITQFNYVHQNDSRKAKKNFYYNRNKKFNNYFGKYIKAEERLFKDQLSDDVNIDSHELGYNSDIEKKYKNLNNHFRKSKDPEIMNKNANFDISHNNDEKKVRKISV